MKEVKKYVEEICDLENKARVLYLKEGRWQEYNEALEKMKPYAPEAFANALGMIPLRGPESKEYYDRVREWTVEKRKLYKISKYLIDSNEYYVCYLSAYKPVHDRIGDCWIFKIIDNKPILYTTYMLLSFNEEKPLKRTGGVEDLDIDQFRNPIESLIVNEANILRPVERDIIDNR